MDKMWTSMTKLSYILQLFHQNLSVCRQNPKETPRICKMPNSYINKSATINKSTQTADGENSRIGPYRYL